jgi:LuxR family transcriptional regulator, maltose regulon positive regulatory protein
MEMLERPRLLETIDAALRPPALALWLAAPVGMGKTVLAQQWQHAHGGRRVSLAAGQPLGDAWLDLVRAPTPKHLVLDDLQCAPDDALAALAESLTALQGCQVLLLSRRGPPAALARLQVQGLLARFDAAALLFTPPEAQAAGVPPSAAGWPAAAAPAVRGSAQGELLANLIDAELLQGLDAPTRRWLAALAWWPPGAAFDAADRTRLHALIQQGLLAGLQAGQWALHPALAHHLRQREPQAWQVACDALLRQARDDEAAEVALAAGEAGIDAAWASAEAALVHGAPRRLAARGHAALAAGLRRLPEPVRSWQAWAALAQALAATEPAAARDAAIRALDGAPPDATLARVPLLTQVIGSYFQCFDSTEPLARWLSLVPTLPEPMPPDAGAALAVAGFSALFLREPGHAELPRWQQAAQALPEADIDPNLRLRAAMLLAKQAWYTGRHAELLLLPQRARSALNDARCLPYAWLLWGLTRQYEAWAAADPEAGRAASAEALALAEQHGVHTLNRHLHLHDACFAMWLGDAHAAERSLQAALAGFDSRRRMEAWHAYSVRAALRLEQGDAAEAQHAAALAVDAAEAMGPAPLAMSLWIGAQAAFSLGQAVEPVAERLQALARETHNPRAAVAAAWLRALQEWRRGEHVAACKQVQAVAASMQALGGGGWFGLARPVMAPLVAAALEPGAQAAVVQLVRECRVQAPPEAGEHWPWPLRIRGGVLPRIEVHGLPLALGPKAPLRPLHLLQGLLAAGGAAPAAQLADRLWPEAEGDRAMDSFEIALRRLRALLAVPDALLLAGGVLAINRRCVWVEPARAAGDPEAARHLLRVKDLAD